MRLNVAVEAASVDILNGPGATKLLDAALELHAIGGHAFAHSPGPKVTFTIRNPLDGQPTAQIVEIAGDFVKYGGHYEFSGLMVGCPNAVHVVYWLKESDEFGRGTIKDFAP